MKMLMTIITISLLIIVSINRKLTKITQKDYKQKFLVQLTNTHNFIFVDVKIATPSIINFLSAYKKHHQIQLYQCDPNVEQLNQYCSNQIPVFLIINTVKIDYNGRINNEADLIKWARFRIQQYPTRLHSLSEIKQHVNDKNQIFCFVDREGEQPTRKQFIFIATAKQMHFLYFCHLDASIGRELGLAYGHLVLIRQDLTTNFDYWSEKVQQDNQFIHRLWLNFLIRSFQSQFRLADKDKTHDLVTIQCDFSLECQQELIDVYQYQLIWRKMHPEINIIVKLLPGTEGELKLERDRVHDFPILRFSKTKIQKKIVHQKSGAVLEQTHYTRDVYKQRKTIINNQTIQILLKQYKQNKLKFQITETSIDIRPLLDEEAEGHREEKKRMDLENRSGQQLKEDL